MKLIGKAENLCEDHYLMKLTHEGDAPLPGQFVNIKATGFTDPLLRRPISIFDYSNKKIELIFREVGRVTSFMKDHATAGLLDITGPFGKGFTVEKNSNALLVGGGVGNAPLHYLSKLLRANGSKVTYIYGARSASLIYCKEKFCTECDSLSIMTDDGSEGDKGFVTHKLEEILKMQTFDRAYICGPTPMMRNSMKLLSVTKIPVEVSLENYFGCGIGICSGCSIDTTLGKKRACVDGPVFDGRILEWDSL